MAAKGSDLHRLMNKINRAANIAANIIVPQKTIAAAPRIVPPRILGANIIAPIKNNIMKTQIINTLS